MSVHIILPHYRAGGRARSTGVFFALVSALFVLSPPAFAALFTSVQTGTFNIGTTWGGACAAACTQGVDYPGTNDSLVIANGHVVTVTATPGQSVIGVTVNFGGTLTINNGVTLTATGNYVNEGT